jgi:hypothetical protein
MELACVVGLFERAIDAGEQVECADGLFDEVHGAGLHRLHGDRDVAGARDHDRRHGIARRVKTPQQLDAADSGQIGVDQEAAFDGRVMGVEEGFRRREILHRPCRVRPGCRAVAAT